MVNQQVVRVAGVDQLSIIPGKRLDAFFRRLDEDIRLVASRPQDLLNAEHFVADRVSVAERCEHLMDADHARLRSPASAGSRTGPEGSRASTCSAGTMSLRRRSNHPGSGAI